MAPSLLLRISFLVLHVRSSMDGWMDGEDEVVVEEEEEEAEEEERSL